MSTQLNANDAAEVLLKASAMRQGGIPALAFWDCDRQRWRIAVGWPGQRVRRFDAAEATPSRVNKTRFTVIGEE